MMLLSRFWYVLLGILLGVALYAVYVAVGQYNRRNGVEMNRSPGRVSATSASAARSTSSILLTARPISASTPSIGTWKSAAIKTR